MEIPYDQKVYEITRIDGGPSDGQNSNRLKSVEDEDDPPHKYIETNPQLSDAELLAKTQAIENLKDMSTLNRVSINRDTKDVINRTVSSAALLNNDQNSIPLENIDEMTESEVTNK